jgi:hypothetical protein
MPSYTFACTNPSCGETRDAFLSMSQADDLEANGICDSCFRGKVARVPVVPLAAHLYGNPQGYYKASPLNRFTTKTVSQKEGNKNAIG